MADETTDKNAPTGLSAKTQSGRHNLSTITIEPDDQEPDSPISEIEHDNTAVCEILTHESDVKVIDGLQDDDEARCEPVTGQQQKDQIKSHIPQVNIGFQEKCVDNSSPCTTQEHEDAILSKAWDKGNPQSPSDGTKHDCVLEISDDEETDNGPMIDVSDTKDIKSDIEPHTKQWQVDKDVVDLSSFQFIERIPKRAGKRKVVKKSLTSEKTVQKVPAPKKEHSQHRRKSAHTLKKSQKKNVIEKFAIAWDAPQTLNISSAVQISVNVNVADTQGDRSNNANSGYTSCVPVSNCGERVSLVSTKVPPTHPDVWKHKYYNKYHVKKRHIDTYPELLTELLTSTPELLTSTQNEAHAIQRTATIYSKISTKTTADREQRGSTTNQKPGPRCMKNKRKPAKSNIASSAKSDVCVISDDEDEVEIIPKPTSSMHAGETTHTVSSPVVNVSGAPVASIANTAPVSVIGAPVMNKSGTPRHYYMYSSTPPVQAPNVPAPVEPAYSYILPKPQEKTNIYKSTARSEHYPTSRRGNGSESEDSDPGRASSSAPRSLPPRQSWLSSGAYRESDSDGENGKPDSTSRRKRRKRVDEDYVEEKGNVGDNEEIYFDNGPSDYSGYSVSGINVMVTPILTKNPTPTNIDIKQEDSKMSHEYGVTKRKHKRKHYGTITLNSDSSDTEDIKGEQVVKTFGDTTDVGNCGIDMEPTIEYVHDTGFSETSQPEIVPSPDTTENSVPAPLLIVTSSLTQSDLSGNCIQWDSSQNSHNEPVAEVFDRINIVPIIEDDSHSVVGTNLDSMEAEQSLAQGSTEQLTEKCPQISSTNPDLNEYSATAANDSENIVIDGSCAEAAVTDTPSSLGKHSADNAVQSCVDTVADVSLEITDHTESQNTSTSSESSTSYLSEVVEELFPPTHSLRSAVLPKHK